jgi:zinc transporter, ZIP family
MHALPYSYLLSFYLFLGTNVGALTAVIFYKIPKVKALHLYTFCGLVLTGLLAFELVPHALEEYGFISVAFGTSLGILICTCLHGLLEDESPHSYRPALFVVSAIAIHNIPAGLATGSTLDSGILSVSFIAAIVIHQIPEGLAIMTALLLSGRKRLSFLLFFLFSVLLSGIFLFFTNIGHSLELPLQSNGLLLGIAIGFLLFTAVWEFLFKKHS